MRIIVVGGIFGKSASFRATADNTPETNLANGLEGLGHTVHRVGHYEDLSNYDADLIHVHHLSWGAIRGIVDPRPMVLTPHLGFPERRPGLTTARARLLEPLTLRWAYRRSDAWVSLSPQESRFYESWFSVREGIMAIIPNGSPFAAFPVEPSAGDDYLVFVGQLVATKRVDLILKAFAAAEVPPSLRLKLAYHHDAEAPALRRLADELRLESRVDFLGGRPARELAGLIAGARALVLASSTECLPSVLTEAACMGTPFIASRVGGIESQASDLDVLFSPGDEEELTRAIEISVLRSPSAEVRDRRRSQARETYSLERMIERHVELYEQVLDTAHDRRTGSPALRPLTGTLLRALPRS